MGTRVAHLDRKLYDEEALDRPLIGGGGTRPGDRFLRGKPKGGNRVNHTGSGLIRFPTIRGLKAGTFPSNTGMDFKK